MKMITALALIALLVSCKKDDNSVGIFTSLTVNTIQVTSYPLTTNGNSWDPSGGSPDIYFTINQGTVPDISQFVSDTMDDVSASSFLFSAGFPYTVDNLDSAWTVAIWDNDDLDPDDFMGGATFTPRVFEKNAAPSITLFGGAMEVNLNVTWNK